MWAGFRKSSKWNVAKVMVLSFWRVVCERQAASSLLFHHSLSGRIQLPCCEQHFGEAHRPGKDTSCWQLVRNCASSQQPCEWAILNSDLSPPLEPSNDCSFCGNLTAISWNTWARITRLATARVLILRNCVRKCLFQATTFGVTCYTAMDN